MKYQLSLMNSLFISAVIKLDDIKKNISIINNRSVTC